VQSTHIIYFYPYLSEFNWLLKAQTTSSKSFLQVVKRSVCAHIDFTQSNVKNQLAQIKTYVSISCINKSIKRPMNVPSVVNCLSLLKCLWWLLLEHARLNCGLELSL